MTQGIAEISSTIKWHNNSVLHLYITPHIKQTPSQEIFFTLEAEQCFFLRGQHILTLLPKIKQIIFNHVLVINYCLLTDYKCLFLQSNLHLTENKL